MTYACGHNPDPEGYRRTPFHHLAARLGAVALPAAVSLFDGRPPLDQGPTLGCFGHGTAVGLGIALGLPWVPSPGEIYRNARAIDRSPGDELKDNGSSPNQGFRAINEFGIKPMVPMASRNSDCDPATVNDEPKLGDLETEALMVAVGDYGIYSTGQQRVTDICTALAHGKPVGIALAGGSEKFQAYSGGVLGPLNAPIDHFVVLLGYHTEPDGSLVFDGQNSWGLGWGDLGRFHLSLAAVAELEDIIAMDVRKA